MADETTNESTETTAAPKRSRPPAQPKPAQLIQEEPTVEYKPKSDLPFHLVLVGALLVGAISITSLLNANGLLGNSNAKIHDLEIQQQSYKDGIRDVRH